MREISIVQGDSFLLRDNKSIDYLKSIFEERGISLSGLFLEGGLVAFPPSLVGMVSTPEAKIFIRPRHEGITLNHVIRLYNYTYLSKGRCNLSDDLFSLSKSSSFERIVEDFVNELYSLVRKGIAKDFVVEEKDIKTKRGKLNVYRTEKNIKLLKENVFSCKYSKLTEFIELNAALLQALKKIRGIIDAEDYDYLIRKLPETDIELSGNELSRIRVQRKDSHYLKAFYLATLIINETFFELRGESQLYESFLINYDKLFEDFIKLTLIINNNDSDFSEWDENRVFGEYLYNGKVNPKSFRPDILYRRISEFEYASVVDAKNKTSQPFNNQDVYEVMFYCRMLNSKRGVLVYPVTSSQKPAVLKMIKDLEGIRISSVFIDIGPESHNSFLESIENFKKEVYRCVNS